MIAPMILFVLAAASSYIEPVAPVWHTDYHAAQKLAREGGRPLAVFLGGGKDGYQRIALDGKLGTDVEKVLARSYVCVYLDREQGTNRNLLSAFEMPTGLGLVISDKTGDLQAYRNEGQVESTSLASSLSKYADPSRSVTLTESPTIQQVSFYPSAMQSGGAIYAPPAPPAYQPNYWSQPMHFSGGGGRSC